MGSNSRRPAELDEIKSYRLKSATITAEGSLFHLRVETEQGDQLELWRTRCPRRRIEHRNPTCLAVTAKEELKAPIIKWNMDNYSKDFKPLRSSRPQQSELMKRAYALAKEGEEMAVCDA